jgi:hypothetical protein
LGWEDVLKKDLKEIGTSWEGVKSEVLNRLGWRRSVCSCVGLRRLGIPFLVSVAVVILFNH